MLQQWLVFGLASAAYGKMLVKDACEPREEKLYEVYMWHMHQSLA